ncbi:MAG: hypothetical protein A2Z72_07440 [Omnitrophica bacterium RBG_13_46_9]|nr:MAG: hypothetical protein A2Z72_07440 [Omnitrophica bacterium RBG_13_46_9]
MKKALILLVLIVFVPLMLSSCTAPKEAVKGTAKSTGDVIQGAGTGVIDFGKKATEATAATVKTAEKGLVGKGEESAAAGKEAVEAGGEAIKTIIEKPLTGVEQGLKDLDEGIKKSTESDKQVK